MLESVPNAPCGVERKGKAEVSTTFPSFLMHRVELKELSSSFEDGKLFGFLMHRVELKDVFGSLVKITHENLSFLMHRVELKVEMPLEVMEVSAVVPNAPCGVESHKGSPRNFHLHCSVPNAPCGVER